MLVKCYTCKEKLDKDMAVKFKGKYFHKECRRIKRIKSHIYHVLVNKKNIKGTVGQIRGKINEHLENNEYMYILFVLRKKINLKHINGLVYFLNNEEYKKEYVRYKSKKINVKKEYIKIVKCDIPDIKIKSNKKWGELICCHLTQIQKQE